MARALIFAVCFFVSEKFDNDFHRLVNAGQLDAAETELNQAQLDGLDQARYQQCLGELEDRRAEARRLIVEGDELFRDEHYKEARARYVQAQKVDRNNSLTANKIKMADRFHREARARNVKATLSFAIPVATQVLGDYLQFKREEEQRKREEAERAAEEARRKQQQEEEDRRRHRRGP